LTTLVKCPGLHHELIEKFPGGLQAMPYSANEDSVTWLRSTCTAYARRRHENK